MGVICLEPKFERRSHNLDKTRPEEYGRDKKAIKVHSSCIVIFEERYTLILKYQNSIQEFQLDGESDYQRIVTVFKSANLPEANSNFTMRKALKSAMKAIPNTTKDFDNRGLLSTHYLRRRLFDDSRADLSKIKDIHKKIGNSYEVIKALGWNTKDGIYLNGKVSVTVTKQNEFSIRTDDSVAPSYTAVSKLGDHHWSILTNGTKWRLYTNKISASSTNYFEIVLDPNNTTITKYLIAIFGFWTFEEKSDKIDIDVFFNESKNHAIELEENLSGQIMSPDGLFLSIVKGVLDHNMKTKYNQDELNRAKETALKIMYRIWFLAYAESRNLLPISDEKYRPISLQNIRSMIDSYEQDPKNDGCWKDLLKLFKCVRNGSPKHNLPQYNGNLFASIPAIDDNSVRNKFIVSALSGLLEHNGQSIDYSNLSVRHLGNILESIMEYVVRQAERDIMLLEENGKIKEVKTVQKSTYSYKKNDLYLASKEGIARKSTASYYTPDAFVSFLVRRGLEPILEERSKMIESDVKIYEKRKSVKNRITCIDRILDIQVLDPTMGSGHFLVEALNRLTSWATEMLRKQPNHPLLQDIESDRNTILEEQKKLGIVLDQSLLTLDVLLKRRIMKRCIFGVDLNPMATELAKLSLWLDSFAIGVPLTYMDHHIKTGDSTLGSFMDDLENKKNNSLDSWIPSEESNKMINDVINSSDVTINQVHTSEERYKQYVETVNPSKQLLDALTASKIDASFLPKKSKIEFIHKFKNNANTDTKKFAEARKIVNEMSQRRHFFHWELEMMDAFTDARHGFDCIVGNPPWDKSTPNDDEFFTLYDPTFRSLSIKTKKNKLKIALLKDTIISKSYTEYRKDFEEKNKFYKNYNLKGIPAARDLSKLVLETGLRLMARGGTLSMVLPSQILSSAASEDIRKELLKKEIRQIYVFENKKHIFPIHASYRFLLLTLRNEKSEDKFPVGFYLHLLESLENHEIENKKFGTMSKKTIKKLSSEYIIPEILDEHMNILVKMSSKNLLKSGLEDGTRLFLSDGLRKTNDANIFRNDGYGWPVHEGKTIHQYTHLWEAHEFTVGQRAGLKRESTKKVYAESHVEFFDSYRLVFRNITSPTNMRTVIATIIPPQTFHTYSLRSVVLKKNGMNTVDATYINNILYLCGIMNSLTFDYTARANIQMNLSTIINSLPIPHTTPHKNEISTLVAKMLVGTPEFAGLAERTHIENQPLTVKERIETMAKIDALVAISYDLESEEYRTVIDSFPTFKKNPSFKVDDEINWNNLNLKEFYGEMTENAMKFFVEMMESKK